MIKHFNILLFIFLKLCLLSAQAESDLTLDQESIENKIDLLEPINLIGDNTKTLEDKKPIP